MSDPAGSPAAAVLYSRADCPLCFALHRSAQRAARRHGVALRVVDIDSDPALQARYRNDVPVLELPGGGEIRGRATAQEVEAAFAQAAAVARRSAGTP